MTGAKAYMLVEGHGEVAAAQNLISRLSHEHQLYCPWGTPLRWKNLHQWDSPRHGGVRRGAEFARTKPDIAALLILRDEDDGCPAELAPKVGCALRELRLPFPVAYVLLKPEYEVMFLPCLDKMSEFGFAPDLSWDGEGWEARRDVKGWLSGNLPRGTSYKPTTKQLPMTRKLDFSQLRVADVPCFGSLERSLAFLAHNLGKAGAVYPPAALE